MEKEQKTQKKCNEKIKLRYVVLCLCLVMVIPLFIIGRLLNAIANLLASLAFLVTGYTYLAKKYFGFFAGAFKS